MKLIARIYKTAPVVVFVLAVAGMAVIALRRNAIEAEDRKSVV